MKFKRNDNCWRWYPIAFYHSFLLGFVSLADVFQIKALEFAAHSQRFLFAQNWSEWVSEWVNELVVVCWSSAIYWFAVFSWIALFDLLHPSIAPPSGESALAIFISSKSVKESIATNSHIAMKQSVQNSPGCHLHNYIINLWWNWHLLIREKLLPKESDLCPCGANIKWNTKFLPKDFNTLYFLKHFIFARLISYRYT